MDGYEQSLGEVARRLDDVFKRYEQIANELPKTFVTKDLFEARVEVILAQIEAKTSSHIVLEKRIADLEDDKKWLYRLIIGAIILALLGLLISAAHPFSSGGGPKATHASGTKTTVVIS